MLTLVNEEKNTDEIDEVVKTTSRVTNHHHVNKYGVELRHCFSVGAVDFTVGY
jgi:hypothetical protein